MRKTQKEWKRLLAASKFFLILPGMLTFPLERTQKNFHLCRGKGFSLCIFNYATWCLVHILNKYSHRKIPKASATLHTFSKCLKRLHLPLKLCGAADGWHRWLRAACGRKVDCWIGPSPSCLCCEVGRHAIHIVALQQLYCILGMLLVGCEYVCHYHPMLAAKHHLNGKHHLMMLDADAEWRMGVTEALCAVPGCVCIPMGRGWATRMRSRRKYQGKRGQAQQAAVLLWGLWLLAMKASRGTFQHTPFRDVWRTYNENSQILEMLWHLGQAPWALPTLQKKNAIAANILITIWSARQ